MPSGGLIGALRVTLGINTAAFEAGARRAAATANSAASNIVKSFGTMRTAVTGLLAGATVGVIVAAAERALDYASSLDEVSQQLGVTSKDLQEYRYAASQVGIEQEDMDKSLAKLTLTMGQARAGVEKPKAAFKELSDILGKDVLKSAATAGDAIPLISDALAKVQDPAQRAALEVALFGKTGQKLDTLLAGGSSAINDMTETARNLGLVLSDKDIQSADATADKLSELKQVLEASIAKTVSENSTAIYQLADALEHLIVQVPSAINEMGKFFDYVQRGWGRYEKIWGLINGDQNIQKWGAANIKAAEDDLAVRQNYGKPFFGDKLSDSVDKYVNSHGAGAGTSDAAKAAAAAKAQAAAEKAARAAEKAEKDRQKQIERYNSDLAGLERDRLGAEGDLTTDIETRAGYERERVQNDAEAYKNELASKVKLGELLPVQAKRLEAAKTYNTQLEIDAINQKRDDELTKQALSTKDAGLTLQSDLLNGELGEAKTQAERRKLQMQLLDIEYDRQKAALESVLQLNSSTDAEKDIAKARIGQLDVLKGHEAAGIHDNTMGPMEAFGDSIHRTAGQIKEDFEQIEVDGIKSLNDGLVDAIVNSKSLGDVFSSVAKQMLADLIKIGLQAAETSLFGGKSASGGGIGGLISGITSIFGGGGIKNPTVNLSGVKSIPGLAKGGNLTVPNRPGIDTNLLSINGMPAARVNSGETISVTPANDTARGGHTIIVNAQDAVLADTVRGWVAEGIDIASTRGAAGGAAMSDAQSRASSTRKLGRWR